MPQTPLSPSVSIISEMITPALLILASGSLLGTVVARLGRVVDRARKIAADLNSDATKRDETARETMHLLERRETCFERSMSLATWRLILRVHLPPHRAGSPLEPCHVVGPRGHGAPRRLLPSCGQPIHVDGMPASGAAA